MNFYLHTGLINKPQNPHRITLLGGVQKEGVIPNWTPDPADAEPLVPRKQGASDQWAYEIAQIRKKHAEIQKVSVDML